MRLRKLLVLAACLVLPLAQAHADRKTVCTITVNSPDEKNTFRRYLPQDEFDIVELVERGRPDWLDSACRKGVRCDALIISGHFDDGTQFYSDRFDAQEYLPVDDLERVACSGACPGVFADLKEVYLFGCNTLNADVLRSAGSEVTRSLQRAGYAPADAERVTRLLNEQHADSNRDRMRQIFREVPVIYGFTSKAPLGVNAAGILERYFQAAGKGEIATGRPSAKLLTLFAPVSMMATSGLGRSEMQSAYRDDVCQFADQRLRPGQKLAFVHTLLGRPMGEVRMFLDRIERTLAAMSEAERADADVRRELAAIAADAPARQRFLEFARDADGASTRSRMIEVAYSLGWLDAAGKKLELVQMLADHLVRNNVGPAEIDLACSLQARHALGDDVTPLSTLRARNEAAYAAVLACLEQPQARPRVLQALSSRDQSDVEVAQVYLRHRPVSDVIELRSLAASIARMSAPDAQVRALEALARMPLSDPQVLQELARLFPLARSIDVQRAIAGILIRADRSALSQPELVRALRESRIRSVQGPDVIDALIRRLQS